MPFLHSKILSKLNTANRTLTKIAVSNLCLYFWEYLRKVPTCKITPYCSSSKLDALRLFQSTQHTVRK